MILFVSANQSAAVSIIAIDTLRLLKLQASNMYQTTAKPHDSTAPQKRYFEYLSLLVFPSARMSDLTSHVYHPSKMKDS